MSKPLSQEMHDWETFDTHIRPDEWKVREWSLRAAELEAEKGRLQGSLAAHGTTIHAMADALRQADWDDIFFYYPSIEEVYSYVIELAEELKPPTQPSASEQVTAENFFDNRVTELEDVTVKHQKADHE